jgi:hypothetical protein
MRMTNNAIQAEQLFEALLKWTYFPPAVLALYELRQLKLGRVYTEEKTVTMTWNTHQLVETIIIDCLKVLANRVTNLCP